MKNPRKSTVRSAVAVQSGMQAQLGLRQKPSLFVKSSTTELSSITPDEVRTPEEELFHSFLTQHLPHKKAPASLAARIRAIAPNRD
jgi:hypothetical protein